MSFSNWRPFSLGLNVLMDALGITKILEANDQYICIYSQNAYRDDLNKFTVNHYAQYLRSAMKIFE